MIGKPVTIRAGGIIKEAASYIGARERLRLDVYPALDALIADT
jgi:hypothetical protein